MRALWEFTPYLDWELRRILAADRCGSCGSSLYTNGTCPLCDRPRIESAR